MSKAKGMSLATLMLEQLGVARRIVENGHELLPTWRIETPEGTFLISTRFDTNKPEQREGPVFMVTRFMAWKLATSFVLTTETCLGAELVQASDEALFTIGVSHHERLAVLQRMKSDGAVSFSQPMWLASHHIDGCYLKMLPGKRAEATAEEAAALERVFGKNGELPAERLN